MEDKEHFRYKQQDAGKVEKAWKWDVAQICWIDVSETKYDKELKTEIKQVMKNYDDTKQRDLSLPNNKAD